MKHKRLHKVVNTGMKKLVDMGMPDSYEINIQERNHGFTRRNHGVEIIINPERHPDNSYLAFLFKPGERIFDFVRAGLRDGLEKDFAELSIYVLGDIAKTLNCEWMYTREKHVAQYGAWVEDRENSGIYKINVDLFTSFK